MGSLQFLHMRFRIPLVEVVVLGGMNVGIHRTNNRHEGLVVVPKVHASTGWERTLLGTVTATAPAPATRLHRDPRRHILSWEGNARCATMLDSRGQLTTTGKPSVRLNSGTSVTTAEEGVGTRKVVDARHC
jgi:hypothetical protein